MLGWLPSLRVFIGPLEPFIYSFVRVCRNDNIPILLEKPTIKPLCRFAQFWLNILHCAGQVVSAALLSRYAASGEHIASLGAKNAVNCKGIEGCLSVLICFSCARRHEYFRTEQSGFGAELFLFVLS